MDSDMYPQMSLATKRIRLDPDVYSKICFICKEAAPPNEVHHVHYGARACFSCRAFFRRAHQKTRNPDFVCKKGGTCVVTPKNRRKCQACRYALCIEAGMNPSWVLTEEQKRVRFRNVMQKKEKRRGGSVASEDESTSSVPTSLHDGTFSSPEHDLIKTEDMDVDFYPMSNEQREFGDLQRGRVSKFTVSMAREKVKQNIAVKFNKAFESSNLSPELLGKFWEFHLGRDVLVLADIKAYLQFLRSAFESFASLSEAFKSFSESDQSILLERSLPLFEQYYFSQYFIIGNGFQQYLWLYNGRPNENFSGNVNLIDITFEYLDETTKIFLHPNIKHAYLSLLSSLRSKSSESVPPALMANLLLFSGWKNETGSLTEPDRVREHYNVYMSLIDDGASAQVSDVIESIESMAVIFNVNAFLKQSGEPPTQPDAQSPSCGELCLPYTNEEESWIMRQFNMFNAAISSVPVGEKLLKEYVMFAYDVPLGKNFMSQYFQVVVERFRQVLKIHPEVEALPDDDQIRLWRLKLWNGVALDIVKRESFGTAREQVHDVMTDLDADLWNKSFQVVDMNSLKRVSMADFNKIAQILPVAMMDRFNLLVQKLWKIVKDADLFKLMTFIVIFSSDESYSPRANKTVNEIRTKYVKLLHRRMMARNQNISTNMLEAESYVEELAGLLKLFPM